MKCGKPTKEINETNRRGISEAEAEAEEEAYSTSRRVVWPAVSQRKIPRNCNNQVNDNSIFSKQCQTKMLSLQGEANRFERTKEIEGKCNKGRVG